LEALVKKVR
jgi:hypothetical protein